MSNENVIALYNLLFRDVRYYKVYNPTDEQVAEIFANILEVDVDDKADKVEGAVAGHFAGLDADGNLTDSGKSASSFAVAGHNHDTRYLRADEDNLYDAVENTFTFQISDGAPFAIDNTSGDIPAVVTHLNADYVNGKHASAFALVNHAHADYPLKNGDEIIIGNWTFSGGSVPFSIGEAMDGVLVEGLSVQYLNGKEDTDFAAADHNHDSRYYTETEINNLLNGKISVPEAATVDPDAEFIMWVDGGDIIATSNITMGDIATVEDLGAKADKVTDAVAGNIAGLTDDGNLEDSGFSPGDFAAADHGHNELTMQGQLIAALMVTPDLFWFNLVGSPPNYKLGLAGITAPEYDVDLGGDLRIQDTFKLYFGGTGAGDHEGSLYHDGTTFIFSDTVKIGANYAVESAGTTGGAASADGFVTIIINGTSRKVLYMN